MRFVLDNVFGMRLPLAPETIGKRPWEPFLICELTGLQVAGSRPARCALSVASFPPKRASLHASGKLFAQSPVYPLVQFGAATPLTIGTGRWMFSGSEIWP